MQLTGVSVDSVATANVTNENDDRPTQSIGVIFLVSEQHGYRCLLGPGSDSPYLPYLERPLATRARGDQGQVPEKF